MKDREMFYFSDEELLDLLHQDVPYLDNTSFGLGISGNACLEFFPKNQEIILCGIDECERLARLENLQYTSNANNATCIAPKEIFLALQGDAQKLLRVAKTFQNILEYASSIATYTHKMLQLAKDKNPNIALLGTRKTMPFAKKLLLKALVSGGGIPHRLGLSDSILLFKEHRLLCKNLESDFKRLKNTFKEHKIIVEVENLKEAQKFATLGADILQCERFSVKDLSLAIKEIKTHFPHILFSATGGIDIDNVAEFASSGVDMIVSTAMYRAKICDVKAQFHKIS